MSRLRSALPPQQLTSLVLQALAERGAPRRSPDATASVSRETLEGAIETFVNAGARALAEGLEPSPWHAWGLASARSDRDDLADARALRSLVRACLRQPGVHGCFFMRKPPGLRLRVRTQDRRRVERLVRRWAQRSRFDLVELAYEPEQYQFGGALGMEIAHRHFTTDALVALEVVERDLANSLSLPKWALSLLCVMDLVAKVTGDPWEAWDLWSHLRLTGRLGGEVVDPSELGELAAQLEPFVSVAGRRRSAKTLSAADRALVRTYMRANSAAARALRAANDGVRLLYGIRKVIPFWLIFSWNRWGFDAGAQVSIAHGVEHLLNPKRQ